MKILRVGVFRPLRVGVFGLALIGGLVTLTACRQKAPQIIVETAPLPRQPGEKNSYAGAVSNVAPSVVSVYAHVRVKDKLPPSARDSSFVHRFSPEKGHQGSAAVPHEVQALGSGVVFSANGYILTNRHVVEDADTITVTTAAGEEFDAKVVGTDPATDLAVLKVNAKNLPAATLADSSQLRVGDVVLAIGNPFGVGQTVTSGIISATQRGGLGISEYEDFIQTDASINPGNSGGALVDARGRVVGINTAILSNSGGFEGIGLAVPINLARSVTEQLLTRGKVVRGYLGVSLHPLTPALAKAFQVPEGEGALVVDVAPHSPAARAGMKEGDIILELNGKKVEKSQELRLSIAQSAPGSSIRMKVLRLNGPATVTARLGQAPS